MVHPWLLHVELAMEQAVSVYVNFFLYTLVASYLHGADFAETVTTLLATLVETPFVAFGSLLITSYALEHRLREHRKREALTEGHDS